MPVLLRAKEASWYAQNGRSTTSYLYSLKIKCLPSNSKKVIKLSAAANLIGLGPSFEQKNIFEAPWEQLFKVALEEVQSRENFAFFDVVVVVVVVVVLPRKS